MSELIAHPSSSGTPTTSPPVAEVTGRRLPDPRVTGLAGLLALIAVTLWAYGSYISHTGLFSDDWSLTAEIIQPPHGGWLDGVQHMWDRASYRPFSVAYYGIVLGALGTHGTLQLLWSVMVTLAFSGLLFAVLRAVGLGLQHALAVAAIVLVVPMGDATVLWPAAAPIRFGGAMYLAGLLVALSALGRAPGRPAMARHVASLLLYLIALWTYELVAGLVVASLLVYLTVARPKRVLRRWAVDVVLAGAATAWTATKTPKQVHSAHDQIEHARMIASQLWHLYGDVAVPSWVPSGIAAPATAAIVVIGVAFLILMWRGKIGGPGALETRRWIVVTGIALVYAAGAYAAFIPADPYYSPAAVNFGNRVNGVGVAPLVLLAYATVMVTLTLGVHRRPRWRVAALVIAGAWALALVLSQRSDLREHQAMYTQASQLERTALSAIGDAVHHPADHTLILTLGVPGFVAPDLPVFASTWDLQGAVQLKYRNPTLDGFNALSGFSCEDIGIVVPGGPTGHYGYTVVVDVAGHRAWRVRSPDTCGTIAKALQAPSAPAG